MLSYGCFDLFFWSEWWSLYLYTSSSNRWSSEWRVTFGKVESNTECQVIELIILTRVTSGYTRDTSRVHHHYRPQEVYTHIIHSRLQTCPGYLTKEQSIWSEWTKLIIMCLLNVHCFQSLHLYSTHILYLWAFWYIYIYIYLSSILTIQFLNLSFPALLWQNYRLLPSSHSTDLSTR